VHGGDSSNFGELASLSELVIEGSDERIMLNGDQSRHIQHLSHCFPPAADSSLTSLLTAIAVD
jgi:hypothetical protein